jgi:preprotein translocase subunit SecY
VQLVAATIVVMLLDEMVQKGWGIGSGISLFIAAGVAGQIFSDLFSPITLTGRLLSRRNTGNLSGNN